MITHDPYILSIFIGMGEGLALLLLAWAALFLARTVHALYKRLIRWTDEQIAYKGPTPTSLMADPEWRQHAGLGETVTNSRPA